MKAKGQTSIPDQIISVTDSIQKITGNEVREKLIALINELINKDFSTLLQLLYRIDIDEKKIRLFLNQNVNEDAASILADLIIERQLQKIESRKHFKENISPKNDEEKW